MLGSTFIERVDFLSNWVRSIGSELGWVGLGWDFEILLRLPRIQVVGRLSSIFDSFRGNWIFEKEAIFVCLF